jgi:hypothetical protein
MTIEKIQLNNFKKNIYSQSGEDGIIEKILTDKTFELNFQFVEFGAHDGKTNSNCYNLLQNKDYKGLFIEPNKKRYQKLVENTKNYDSININSMVTQDGELSLDSILSENNFENNFDLLSIDIDGFDYQMFESMNLFNPKIIIIEYNQSIPNHVSYVQPYNTKSRHGSSPKSLIELGQKKGYEPVAITDTNLFFLDKEIFDFSNIKKLNLDEDRNDTDATINLFYGYNGDIIFSHSYINLRWHFLKYDLSKVQLVPKYFRNLLEDYSFVKNILYKFYSTFLIFKIRLSNLLKRIRF